MKKNLTKIIVLLLIAFVFIGNTSAQGQNNRTINYQAVAHSNNGTGNTISNTTINVEISISSDTTISPEFEEFHSVTTNEYGLFSLQIGSINSGDFNNIEWSDEDFYLGVSIDGEQMGYQLLVGVPYSFSSLEAVNAKKVNGYTVESNVPANALFTDNQSLSLDSDSLYISNGNAVSINNISAPDNDWTIINNDLYNTNLSGKIGIGTTSMAAKLNVKTDTITNIKRGIQVINSSISNGTGSQNNKVAIYGISEGGGTAENIGISGQGVFGNINKGIVGSAFGGTENWAGYFGDDTSPGTGNVKINDQLVIGSSSAAGSFQLIDGNQGVGRILKSDAQGNAQWVQIGSLGVGVMLKNVYDTNFNSIVDNAEAINGFQVGIDVPSNAVFTDNQNASEVNYNNNISGLTANNTQAAIDELQLNINNAGDMYSSTYDVNQNGKVDTAETINGFQVGINVPANSVFTDDQILSGNFDPSSKLLTINIENGNTLTADLTPLANQINIDNDSLNEIQTLSISNNTISLNKGGGSVSVPNNVFIDGTNVGVATTFNTTGDFNTASGDNSLININTGSGNSAYGDASLINNSSGDSNSAFGRWSMGNNSTGSSNSAFGLNALKTNTTGSNNLAIGADADVSSANLNNATAIGANAKVDISNALVLGDNVKVGIGTSSPNTELDINSPSPVLRIMSTKTNSLASAHLKFGDLSSGSFTETGWVGLPGSGNYLEIGSPNAIYFNTNFSYRMMIDQSGNVGIGTSSPTEKLDVNGDTKISGKLAIGTNPLAGRIFSTFGGSWYLGDDTEDPKITIDGDNNGISWSIGVDDQSSSGGSGNADFVISGGSNLNSPKLTIDNSGKIIFNETTNSYKFPTNRGNDGEVLIMSSTPGELEWGNAGLSSSWITTAGAIYTDSYNVGIGTTNPDYPLEVSYTNSSSTSMASGAKFSSTTDPSSTSNYTIGLRSSASSNSTIGSWGIQAIGSGSGSGEHVGIYANAQGTNGNNYGGKFVITNSNPSGNNYGLYVYNFHNNNPTGTNYALYATSSSNGTGENWAGYFNQGDVKIKNNLEIDGTLKISGGSPVSGHVLTTNGAGEATWAAPSGGSSPWSTSNSNIHYNSGNVGIGVSSPSKKLEVNGESKFNGNLILGSSSGSGASLDFTANGSTPSSLSGDYDQFSGYSYDDDSYTLIASSNVYYYYSSIKNAGFFRNQYNQWFLVTDVNPGTDNSATNHYNTAMWGNNSNYCNGSCPSAGSVVYNSGSGSTTNYEINTAYGGNANMIAIAYGTISSNGTKYNCSDNVLSASYSNGTWTVSFDNISYNYLNCTAIISPIDNADPVIPSINSVSGNLLVKLYGVSSGGNIQGNGFTFVIYKN